MTSASTLAICAGGHRRVVREVEARALGVHERALLLHVIAQHLAQRLVHQVRGRVVAHRLRAALGIDARAQHIADRHLAFDDAAVVAEHRRLDLDRVLDDHARARVAQLAGVADLSARLGVERRVVEHDHGVVAGRRARRGRAVDVDRADLHAVARELVVAVELRVGAAVLEAGRDLELAGIAGALALLVEQFVEARLVDRDAALAAHVGRQIDRKAVGVVQLERGVAIDLLAPEASALSRISMPFAMVRKKPSSSCFSTSVARFSPWRSSG